MFSQDEIDSVLNQAKEAVDALASDVGSVSADLSGGLGPRAGWVTGEAEFAGGGSSGGAAVAEAKRPSSRAAMPGDRIQRILKLRVPVVVKLAERRMLLSEVLKLAPGKILEFERNVASELDLMVNNRRIGKGVAVKVDEHFGLRVSSIGDLRERISSFAG